MIHLGDITKISGYEVPTVDIVTGGSPCQDLSVAGKRAGLAGERSGLFMEQIRIIKEMREKEKQSGKANVDIRPRYMVWENVPGAFSSNKGEDFRAVLEETAKVVDKDAVIPEPAKGKWTPAGCIVGDGWSIAWRVHDAQFWGVPQRRKRISLVADFGGQSAPEILFERNSLSGNIETCGQKGQGTSEDAERCFGKTSDGIVKEEPESYTLKIRGGCDVDRYGKKAGKGPLVQTELSGTLGVSQDQTLFANIKNENNQITEAQGFPLGFRPENTRCYEEKSTTICNGTRPDFTCGVIGFNRGNGSGVPAMEEKQPTLQAAAGESGNNQPLVCQPIIENESVYCLQGNGIDRADTAGCNGKGWRENESYTLNTIDRPAVCYSTNTVDVELEVSVRKYPVDVEKLIDCLQNHRTLTIGEIADKLNKPKTLVEHWFRRDKCFAIPDADVWFELKELLGIETEEFDKSITTFETKPGNYDMRNRIYCGEVAPTLMRGSEKNLYNLSQETTAYRKTGHPQNAEQGQGWEETDVNDTLNIFDNSEGRTPTIITQSAFENHSQDTRYRPLGEVCSSVSATYGMGGNNQPFVVKQVYDASRRHNYEPFGEVCETVQAHYGTGGGNVPMVVAENMDEQKLMAMQAIGEYSDCGVASSLKQRDYKDATDLVVSSNWDGSQIAPTLTQNNANGAQRMPDKDNFNAVLSYGIDCFNQTQTEEVSRTLLAGRNDKKSIPCTYGLDRASFNQGENAKFDFSIEEEKIGAQLSRGPGAVCQSIVRRLTPLECERLQGYPDYWTDIGEWVDSKGKKHKDADSPRYKALGNSIALPFWQWMAYRMCSYLKEPTMASLFDGIGGFPLVFSRAGCKPIWASEIEEFPIAVTKIRFPE